MKNLLLLLTLCFGLFACQQSGSNSTTENHNNENNAQASADNENPDQEFALKAADGGMFEVKLGELAQSKGSSAEIKTFAQQMVTDHGKANEELKSLAQTKNIVLPASLSEEKQKMYDELADKSGVDFDKAYADMMVKDHKQDIDLFEKEADKGDDADLKSWASGKLPTLKHHLEMAEKMQSAL